MDEHRRLAGRHALHGVDRIDAGTFGFSGTITANASTVGDTYSVAAGTLYTASVTLAS